VVGSERQQALDLKSTAEVPPPRLNDKVYHVNLLSDLPKRSLELNA